MVVTEFVFRTADVSGKMTAFNVVVPTRLSVQLLQWFQVRPGLKGQVGRQLDEP